MLLFLRPGPSPRRVVLRAALSSRLVIGLLGWSSSLLLTAYDSSGSVAAFGVNEKGVAGRLPPSASAAAATLSLNHLATWDAIHLLGISSSGYLWEHSHAFYPLLPALVRAGGAGLGAAAAGMTGGGGEEAAGQQHQWYLVAGFLASNAAFICAALVLYELGLVVLRDRRRALAGALLFCYTPAGIFMSALYTESLFALFSFAGMWCIAPLLARGGEGAGRAGGAAGGGGGVVALARRSLACSVCFGLAAATRSNGTTLLLYLAWVLLPIFGTKVWQLVRRDSTRRRETREVAVVLSQCTAVVATGLVGLASALLVVMPTVAFQTFGASLYCPASSPALALVPTWLQDALRAKTSLGNRTGRFIYRGQGTGEAGAV